MDTDQVKKVSLQKLLHQYPHLYSGTLHRQHKPRTPSKLKKSCSHPNMGSHRSNSSQDFHMGGSSFASSEGANAPATDDQAGVTSSPIIQGI
jgi:hypothetical protein